MLTAKQREKVIDRLKVVVPDAPAAEVLEQLVDDAASFAEAYTNRTAIPDGMLKSVGDLAVVAYNRTGVEGESARSEGGESYNFEASPEYIFKALKVYRLVRGAGEDIKPHEDYVIEITENGEFRVSGYDKAKVDVPQPEGSIDIASNGNYDVTAYEEAHVNVPQPEGVITLTENAQGVDIARFAEANVEVPEPYGTLQITQNGEYDVTQYKDAEVNVPVDDTLGKLLTGTLEDYTNADVTSLNSCAFCNSLGTATLSFPNVAHVGETRRTNPGSTFLNYAGDIVLPNIHGLTGGKNFMGSGIKAVHWESWGIDEKSNLGIGSQEFSGCESLESVYIDGSSTLHNLGGCQVSYAAFQNCTSLHTVELKKTNTRGNFDIASSAFSGCSSLTKLVLDSVAPYKWSLASANALQGTPIAAGTGYVYVPDELVDTYRAATNWATLADQIKPLSELEV